MRLLCRDGQEIVQYYCKWQGLPYERCTWENEDLIAPKFQNEIDEYMTRRDSRHVPSPVFRRVSPTDYVKLNTQPEWVTGGTVRRAAKTRIVVWC